MNAIVSSHPDAKLLALCARFRKMQAAYEATNFRAPCGSPEEDAADAERDRIIEPEDSLTEAIYDTPATTFEGVQAVALALRDWKPDCMGDHFIDNGNLLMRALLRDLTEQAEGGTAA